MIKRNFLIGGIGIPLALVLLVCLFVLPAAAGGKVIRVLNWQGYGSDEAWAIKKFEKMTGYKIEHDYFTSEEELLTKIRTAPGMYDVVLPNVAYLSVAMKEGLVEAVDTAKLKNWANLIDKFKNLEAAQKDGRIYGVPRTWGATAMVYNSKEYPKGLDSMSAFWDPKFKGKIGWWDSYEDSTVLMGIALGEKTPYRPKDLKAIKAKMMSLMPNVKTLWSSEDEFDKLFANGDITVGIFWSGSASRAKNKMKLPMEFVVPKEGGIGWIDTWCVVKDAPNREGALKWIDFMISPEFFVQWDTTVGAPAPTNKVTLDKLPQDSFNRRVMGNPEVVKRLVWMETVPEATRKKWNAVWESVKAAQ